MRISQSIGVEQSKAPPVEAACEYCETAQGVVGEGLMHGQFSMEIGYVYFYVDRVPEYNLTNPITIDLHTTL